MGEAKKEDPSDPHNLSPQGQLRFEIAQELGLESKVIGGEWRNLTAKGSGRIEGLIAKRKHEMKQEALQRD